MMTTIVVKDIFEKEREKRKRIEGRSHVVNKEWGKSIISTIHTLFLYIWVD
jgi:hypothetical protein